MPSVGMRRSTRVLGARVLRSGRRLLTEPREGGGKHMRASNVESKWMESLDDSADGGGDAGDRLKDLAHENKNVDAVDISLEPETDVCASEGDMEVEKEDKMYGIVYRRKRKREDLVCGELTEDKRFGKKYVRKRWRKKCRAAEPFEIYRDVPSSFSGVRELVVVVNEPSYDCGYLVASFLTTVLSYMSRVRIGVRRLSKFLLSGPVYGAYAAQGVLFLKDSNTVGKPGFCIISRSRSLLPMFSVDFCAVPFSFVLMHTSMSLRSMYLSGLLVAHWMAVDDKDEKGIDLAYDKEPFVQIPSWSALSDSVSLSTQTSSWSETSHSNDNLGRTEFSYLTAGSPKSTLRNVQSRNSRKIQKRRTSLRRKRGRTLPSSRAPKASESLASDFFRIRNDKVQFSPAVPSSRVLRSSAANIKELNSSIGVSGSDLLASSCSANLLIIETNKCYREEGATITLELSSSNQWFLAVMKNGIKRCNLTAQKVMRPPCSNRFTHSTIWAGDPGWKLEFLNKQDWSIFKELYKECSDRNLQAPAEASVIPVPGVKEVSSPVDNNHEPYVRPDSYITVKYDELTRALVKKSSIYDMDSDDEEWLAKFNNELHGESCVTPESFELLIDALEKGIHGRQDQDENFDEQMGYESCMNLVRREVIDAIRTYWIKKRKQKRSALVRIFQLYQPRRTQVIPKSVLRKKRSFKRQAGQGGRGKQRSFLQAMAAQRVTLQRQKNAQKLQEAKAAAERSEKVAIQKRQRAQVVMENADLATYRAMMALRIAEAARIPQAFSFLNL